MSHIKILSKSNHIFCLFKRTILTRRHTIKQNFDICTISVVHKCLDKAGSVFPEPWYICYYQQQKIQEWSTENISSLYSI